MKASPQAPIRPKRELARRALQRLLARSSNATPANVRAIDRTVSETSTSPGAHSLLMREAMLYFRQR